MTTALPPADRKVRSSRLWGLVAAAGFAWVVGYAVDGSFWDYVVYHLVGLDAESHFGASIRFFVYDTTKILLLPGGIIFIVTVLRSFVTIEATRRLLGGRGSRDTDIRTLRLGMNVPIDNITDCQGIMAYGVMSTPALVIDGEVKTTDRVPSVRDLTDLLAGAPA